MHWRLMAASPLPLRYIIREERPPFLRIQARTGSGYVLIKNCVPPGLPMDRPSSSKRQAAWNPNLARAVTQRRGEGIIPRINVHADSHGPSMITRARERASAVNSTKYWTISPPRSETIHTSAGRSRRAPTGTSCACDCTGRQASTNAPIRQRLRMVAQTVASRDGCRREIVHIGEVVSRADRAVAAHVPRGLFRFGASPFNRCPSGNRRNTGSASTSSLLTRSAFSRRAQIIGETGADVRHEQFIDAHPALRELLLIKVGHESIQRRKAAFD
jgi:hypothetical protein